MSHSIATQIRSNYNTISTLNNSFSTKGCQHLVKIRIFSMTKVVFIKSSSLTSIKIPPKLHVTIITRTKTRTLAQIKGIRMGRTRLSLNKNMMSMIMKKNSRLLSKICQITRLKLILRIMEFKGIIKRFLECLNPSHLKSYKAGIS